MAERFEDHGPPDIGRKQKLQYERIDPNSTPQYFKLRKTDSVLAFRNILGVPIPDEAKHRMPVHGVTDSMLMDIHNRGKWIVLHNDGSTEWLSDKEFLAKYEELESAS